MRGREVSILAGAVGIVITAWACGGSSSSSPTSPTPTPPSNPPPSSVTVTITGSGVSTHAVDLAVNGTVTFVNNDTSPHEIASNPHPVHTDCPPVNMLGTLQPGEMRATGALTVARRCGWHDHLNPGAAPVRRGRTKPGAAWVQGSISDHGGHDPLSADGMDDV